MKDENLTVLVLATTFPRSEDDSIPQFVYELCKELEENKLKTIVLSPHHANVKRRETMSGLSVYRYPYFLPFRYQKLVYQGGILPTMKRSILAMIQFPILLLSLLAHVIWLLRAEDIDIIHSHWLVPNGLIGSLVSSSFHVTHVMTLHAGGVLGLRNVPLNSAVVNFVYNRCDIIIPVSTHIRDNFKAMLDPEEGPSDDKFYIQPMGAHTENFDIASKESLREDRGLENNVIGLYVGRLAEKKGLEYLLKAIEDLRVGHENFRMIIVGTGSLEEELHEYVEQKDIEEYVKFTGWVTETELRSQYILADFVVVPSIETKSGDTEGMPTVIAEAFASGNPVIASEVGGIPDVVVDGENGYLVQQKQPDELLTKIELLIEEPDTRAELSKGALETAEKLDWKHCGETYAHLLRSAHRLRER